MEARFSSELDEQLRTSLVGGLEPRKVEIVDYDPEWPRRFEWERSRLDRVLGSLVRRIEHIGSTAVPGLAAKPVVDILVTVDDVESEESYRDAVEGLGFELRVTESNHRAFRTAARDVNLHFWRDDDPEVSKYLLFRDHLRSHADDRALYEGVKRELALRDWPDVNYYADAKSSVISEILQRAAKG